MKGRKMMSGLSYISPRYISEAEFESAVQCSDAAAVRKNKYPRVWIIAALIAAMLLMMGAAVYTRWSNSMQVKYNPSEEIKQQAENSGLSMMFNEAKDSEDPNEVLSATDQGITVTIVQTIVDAYDAELTFRIEGFALPEGRLPDVWPIVSIDGSEHFYSMQEGRFFDGTLRDEQGNRVYMDGTPVQCDADGIVIPRYVANGGSLEYTHHISFSETDGRYLGKEIQVRFPYIGIQSTQKAGPSEPVVEGNWTLNWILTGTDSSITVTPNAEIGSSGVVLLDAELGPRTIRTRYRVSDYWEGWDKLVELPQAICGVRMKDGSEYRCLPSASGFEDQENMIYFMDSVMSDAIVDFTQVESLMFHRGWEKDADGNLTIQVFDYIPIS